MGLLCSCALINTHSQLITAASWVKQNAESQIWRGLQPIRYRFFGKSSSLPPENPKTYTGTYTRFADCGESWRTVAETGGEDKVIKMLIIFNLFEKNASGALK